MCTNISRSVKLLNLQIYYTIKEGFVIKYDKIKTKKSLVEIVKNFKKIIAVIPENEEGLISFFEFVGEFYLEHPNKELSIDDLIEAYLENVISDCKNINYDCNSTF